LEIANDSLAIVATQSLEQRLPKHVHSSQAVKLNIYFTFTFSTYSRPANLIIQTGNINKKIITPNPWQIPKTVLST